MAVDSKPFAPALEKAVLEELYALSNGKAYGVNESLFAEILASVGRTPQATPLPDLYRSLRLEELALARGCALGNDAAWEVFLTRYREKLYDSARQITREDSSARELADSIYADLFGTTTRDGVRNSKLSSYSGRGSLEGWLRTVLAQEWVNRYRKQKREVSLEEESEAGMQFAAPEQSVASNIPQTVVAATDAALSGLAAEDRYILSSYFLDKRTLVEIARVLRVHESTVSRKVEKLAKTVRKKILDSLMKAGMSRRQAEESMDFDVRDWPGLQDVRSQLAREAPNQALPGPTLTAVTVQESPKETFQPIEGKKDQSSI